MRVRLRVISSSRLRCSLVLALTRTALNAMYAAPTPIKSGGSQSGKNDIKPSLFLVFVSAVSYEEEVWEPSTDGLSGASFRQVRIFKQDPKGTVGLDGVPLAEDSKVMFAVYREYTGSNWKLTDAGFLDAVTAIR